MKVVRNIVFICDPYNKNGFWKTILGYFIIISLFIVTIYLGFSLLGILVATSIDPCILNMTDICSMAQECRNYTNNFNTRKCSLFGVLSLEVIILIVVVFVLIIHGIYLLYKVFFQSCIIPYQKANEFYELSESKKNDEIININIE